MGDIWTDIGFQLRDIIDRVTERNGGYDTRNMYSWLEP